ncbi:MAG: sulfite exporter TauE/SafE family protein [Bacteroidota bacterium]
MLLALLGALLVGLSLGLLGSGGSILTVPVLIYLVGQPEKEAIAESLGIVGLIALSGSVLNAVQKKVDWRSVALFALPGMVGTAVGATLSGFVSGLVQLTVFAVTMLAAAVLMFRGRPEAEGERSPPWGLVAFQGLLIGVLTGFVGVGGGFILVPALVLLVGLPIHVAIGTSLTIIVLNSASGFVRYLGVLAEAGLSVDVQLVGVFGAVGVVGSVIGNRIGARVPRQQLRKGFAVFLVVMAAYILWRSVPGLA